jgi:class 3 adenylate cyclase
VDLPIRYTQTDDGVAIAYATIGNGPAIIVLQTLPFGDLAHYLRIEINDEWISFLADTFEVLLFDHRGAGQSDRNPAAITVDALLSDVSAVVRASGLTRFGLYAESTGIPLAARYAALHPDLVDRLVLEAAEQIDIESPLGQLRAVDWDLYLQTVMRKGLDFKDEAYATQLVAGARGAVSPEVGERIVRALAELDFPSIAREVQTPALVGVWHTFSADRVELGRTYARQLGNAQFLRSTPESYPIYREFYLGERSLSSAAESAIRLVLFTDVEASTDLTDRFGDAKARDLLREHERLTREALAQSGGTEIKTMGDGFMASFTSASGALDAAIAMQRAITDHFAATETPIRIRVGINAGEPIEEDDDLYGTAVIQAARVMGKADGGQVLVTDTVRNLVAGKDYRFHDHGTHDLKGFEEPARLFEVAWAL